MHVKFLQVSPRCSSPRSGRPRTHRPNSSEPGASCWSGRNSIVPIIPRDFRRKQWRRERSSRLARTPKYDAARDTIPRSLRISKGPSPPGGSYSSSLAIPRQQVVLRFVAIVEPHESPDRMEGPGMSVRIGGLHHSNQRQFFSNRKYTSNDVRSPGQACSIRRMDAGPRRIRKILCRQRWFKTWRGTL